MMKKILLSVLFGAVVLVGLGQFQIGHTTRTFVDPDRNNREIPCELYYPSDAQGDDVTPAAGVFPQVIFGHGFVMGFDAYENIWQHLVPNGFVMIFPTTEGGLPDHGAFGLDLAYVGAHFYDDVSADNGDLFFDHLSEEYAIMGHSMGGGATWLAAAGNSGPACIAGLAPAETNPSAITAGGAVSCPAMVLSGSSDGVTPPAENHQPIYDGSGSSCKVFVNIIDGSHCGYANSGSLCDLGEFGFSGLDRETQQMITHDLLLSWFNLNLYGIQDAFAEIQNYDLTQANTETTVSCAVDVIELADAGVVSMFPVPAQLYTDIMMSEEYAGSTVNVKIYDGYGRVVKALSSIRLNNDRRLHIDVAALNAGCYTVQIITPDMDHMTCARLLISRN